jgi:uncharacterized protein YkwD
MKILFFLILLFSRDSWPAAHPDDTMQKQVVDAVNKIRQEGCYCGRKYMAPVRAIVWNEKLYKSAYTQAEDMYKNNYFAHISRDGLDIGARLDKAGYNWMVAGENLGEGQRSFEEVLLDWLKSYSHCTMLMHPEVNEMAVAKVDKYWVQHFGKQMPVRK